MNQENQEQLRGITVLGMVVDREEERLVKTKAVFHSMSVSDYLRNLNGLSKRGKRDRPKKVKLL